VLEGDPNRLRFAGIGVNDACGRLPARQLDEKLGRPPRGDERQLGGKPPGEPLGGLALGLERDGGPANTGRVECRYSLRRNYRVPNPLERTLSD
jgi:hypothetical protein